MTIKEIKEYLKVNRITYEMLSKKAGIPLTTIKYIFSGKTENPRIDTMRAIETALGLTSDGAWTDDDYANGITNAICVSITPLEDDLLYLFRQLGAKRGDIGQKTFMDIGKLLLEMDNK